MKLRIIFQAIHHIIIQFNLSSIFLKYNNNSNNNNNVNIYCMAHGVGRHKIR